MVELVDEISPSARPVGPTNGTADALVVSQGVWSLLGDIALTSIVFFGVLIAMEILLAVISGTGPDASPPNAWLMVAERAILSLVTIGMLFGVLRKNGHSKLSIGWSSGRGRIELLWGFAAYVSIFGYLTAVMIVVTMIWPDVVHVMQETQERNLQRLPEMTIWSAAVFSLMVGISEEVFFRGFLLTRLRTLTRSWPVALVLTSAVFAVLHAPQGWFSVLVIVGLSLLLGLWFVWRRSLVAPIVAHALFDTTSLVLLNELVR